MYSYTPIDHSSVIWLCTLLTLELIAGFGLQRSTPTYLIQVAPWLMSIFATIVANSISIHDPAGFRMLAIIVALFLGMKAIVTVNSRASGQQPLQFLHWLAFAAAWPGMEPRIFTTRRKELLSGSKQLALHGILSIVVGLVFIAASKFIWHKTASKGISTIVFFIGASLVVHFGLFSIVAAGWCQLGFDCKALFHNPLQTCNLREFWGQRWNIGFSEMIATIVYRPLKNDLPIAVGLFVAFALSGLLHEVAISLPVKAGYGRPFAYFLLHGILVAAEYQMATRGIVLRGWLGRIWTLLWLILPLPILFHQAFLAGVVWPLI